MKRSHLILKNLADKTEGVRKYMRPRPHTQDDEDEEDVEIKDYTFQRRDFYSNYQKLQKEFMPNLLFLISKRQNVFVG